MWISEEHELDPLSRIKTIKTDKQELPNRIE